MGVLNPQVGEICRALYVGRGGVTRPSLSFESRPTTGFYLQGDEDLACAVGGTEVFVITTTGFLLAENIQWQSGTAFIMTLDHAATAARTWTFQDATDTVVGRDTTDTLTAKTIASGVGTGVFSNAVGTTLLPSYTFTGDLNTGFSSATADTPIISAAGAAVFTGSATVITLGGVVDRTITLQTEDARTTTVDVFTLASTTTGVAAAGIGTGLLFQAESADETTSDAGELAFSYTDVTAASEDTVLDVFLRVAGAALEPKYRFTSTAGAGFQLDFAHAVTADRVVTFPDLTGTVTLTAGAQTLTDKTLTSPSMTTATITSGGLAITAGAVTGLKNNPFIDAAGSDTLTVARSGEVIIANEAATQTYTLPAATNAGVTFTFVCGNAGGQISLDPVGDDTISLLTDDSGTAIVSTATTGTVLNTAATNVAGDTLTIVADGVSRWYMISQNGIWSVT